MLSRLAVPGFGCCPWYGGFGVVEGSLIHLNYEPGSCVQMISSSDTRRLKSGHIPSSMLVILAKSGSRRQMPDASQGHVLAGVPAWRWDMKPDDNLCLCPSPSLSHTSTTTLDTLVRNLRTGIQGWFQNVQAPRIHRHKQPLIHGSSDDEAMCFPWFESSRKARRQQHKTGRATVVRIQEFVRPRLGRRTDGVEGGLWAGPRRASLHVEPHLPHLPRGRRGRHVPGDTPYCLVPRPRTDDGDCRASGKKDFHSKEDQTSETQQTDQPSRAATS